MAQYKLKEPVIFNAYEGEYPVIVGGVYRAIFKASGKFFDGYIREDLRVHNYVEQAKAAGQPYGLYHFFLPDDVSRQMDTFMSVVHREGLGQMPPILDVECDPAKFGVSKVEWGHQVKTALDIVERETSFRPIIYTSPYYWSFVSPVGWSPSTYHLWTADYPHETMVDGISYPSPLPKGWTQWALWQYADDGREQGYHWNDLNTISPDFKTYLDNTDWGQDVIPPGEIVRWVGNTKSTSTPYTNVRPSPGTSGSPVGRLLPLTPIRGIGELVESGAYTWMEIIAPTVGWVATVALEYTETGTPIPPPEKPSDIVIEDFSISYTVGSTTMRKTFTTASEG